MKLASLKEGGRDGTLLVVEHDLTWAVSVPDIAPTLQVALEDWDAVAPRLQAVYEKLNRGEGTGFALNTEDLASPLPRAYQFLDGSAYLAHVERVRRARGAEMPPSFLEDPLMYQAASDGFLAPTEPIRAADEAWGIDMEAEVGVVTGDVPMGADPEEAGRQIRLVLLINDVSLRNLIPAELGKGFGFLQSKPRSSLSPVAVTPDELGDAWRDYKVHLPLVTHLNDELFGRPDAGEDMQFNLAQLVAHGAKTRPLSAGTIVGSGTVANKDQSVGASCLAERRVIEVVEQGEAKTPFLKFGDRVRIEMFDAREQSIFGAIDQRVEQA